MIADEEIAKQIHIFKKSTKVKHNKNNKNLGLISIGPRKVKRLNNFEEFSNLPCYLRLFHGHTVKRP